MTATSKLPTIPDYQILGELGRGGMGIVYKAHQQSHQRTVALKLIHAGAYASEHARARLRTEAEAISRLNHEYIVGILDIGEHDGLPYLVMEHVEGRSLDQFLSGRPAPAELAGAFVRKLALAVQHTHEQRIIHRDLKPANILLEGCKQFESTPGDIHDAATMEALHPLSYRPRITDFGLAKLLDGDSTAWTMAGAVLGTASYMSPEQASGKGQEIGPASDIYALGVILYELLAGRPPFQGSTISETMLKVIQDAPPTLSQIGVDAPADLESICQKCLEKAPADRFESAAELAEELDRFLSGKAVRTSTISDRQRLERRASRDGFTILEELGDGPRSTVYRAAFGPMQQAVALKVFARDIVDESAWNERIQSAAQSWQSLNHPQIALPRQTFWWDGLAVIASDFAPQGTLATALKSQRFSVRAALTVVEQLAEVVCYLHRQGIVHGNLKPSNILIAADGIPRVIDFRPMSGLSFGSFEADGWDAEGLAYLAPELVSDATAIPLPVTDNYGLAAILYALLCGRPPLAAESTEVLLEHIRTKAPDPISKFNPDVPHEIEALCKGCLRKRPFWRMARAFDVLSTVRHCLKKLEGPGKRPR